MPCNTCRNYTVIDVTKGECRLSPPVPVGEYPREKSDWPIVQPLDDCAQINVGVHPGTTHATCVNYMALTNQDPGCCLHPDATENCADGRCVAIPPTPTGEYRGDLSLWTRVSFTGLSCETCYSGI